MKIHQNKPGRISAVKKRHAIFSIWLGTGGSRKIEGRLPSYEVLDQLSGQPIAAGMSVESGSDTSSGDFVHSIDLSMVPEGGPYKIAVKGCGCFTLSRWR